MDILPNEVRVEEAFTRRGETGEHQGHQEVREFKRGVWRDIGFITTELGSLSPPLARYYKTHKVILLLS